MANDRGVLTKLRRALDGVFGEGATSTVVLRLPEALRVRPGHFRADLSPQERRSLFVASVTYFEIETHSYCNRTCWFCPNSTIDRRSKTHYLPEATFLQAMRDLESVGYHGRVGFSRYNEPFADEIIFERIAQAREALPRSRLQVYSNGDFLTPETLGRAVRLGMNELFLGVYLPNHVAWEKGIAERFIARVARRLRVTLHGRREAPGERLSYEARCDGAEIHLFCPNYAVDGVDRGGAVTGVPVRLRPRVSPCLYAVTDLYVDYNGQVMPCCHLRSDVETHRACSLARLDERPGSIFDAYASVEAARWRKVMIEYGPKEGVCRGCRARELADTRLAKALYWGASKLKLPERLERTEAKSERPRYNSVRQPRNIPLHQVQDRSGREKS